jgi:hypothetical protein
MHTRRLEYVARVEVCMLQTGMQAHKGHAVLVPGAMLKHHLNLFFYVLSAALQVLC